MNRPAPDYARLIDAMTAGLIADKHFMGDEGLRRLNSDWPHFMQAVQEVMETLIEFDYPGTMPPAPESLIEARTSTGMLYYSNCPCGLCRAIASGDQK